MSSILDLVQTYCCCGVLARKGSTGSGCSKPSPEQDETSGLTSHHPEQETRNVGPKHRSYGFAASALAKFKGLGKSKPAKDDQIHRHKGMVAQRQQWQTQAGELQAILKKLGDSYASAKGDFALSRYEEIKFMIKEAIQQFQVVEEKAKRGSFKVKPEGEGSAEGGRKLGAITKLRMHAEGFASSNEDLQKKEHDYSKMSAKEVQADLDLMRKDLLQYKQDYYSCRDRLQLLAKEYEDSKRFDPTKRYAVLKQLVKDATRS